MLPTWDITDEDEKTLLESIADHNILTLEWIQSRNEQRRIEIDKLRRKLRFERQEIIKKYNKVEGNQCLDLEGRDQKA